MRIYAYPTPKPPTTFTEPLEKGWLKTVLADVKLEEDARNKVNAMSKQEKQEFVAAALPEPQDENLIRERSRKAALELVSFLDISFRRPGPYANSLEQTIAICIEQNMKGIHR